jgi:hypothetical protein
VITKLTNLGFLRIAGLAAGAAAVSGTAVLVTASAAGYTVPFLSPSSHAARSTTVLPDQQAGKPSAVCSEFVAHFSSDLNTSQAAVNAAFQKAIGETLADEVKNGKLTQPQADAIKQKVAGQTPCAIAGAVHSGGSAGAKLGMYRQALLTAAASALGITDQTLKTDLAHGMTLSQIAAAQAPAVTEAQFRSRLIANLTPLLDKAVAAKQLTATQEKAIVKRLQTGPIPYWNKPISAGNAAATPGPTS